MDPSETKVVREPGRDEEPTWEQCAAAPKMNGDKDWCEGYHGNSECHTCWRYAFRKEYE